MENIGAGLRSVAQPSKRIDKSQAAVVLVKSDKGETESSSLAPNECQEPRAKGHHNRLIETASQAPSRPLGDRDTGVGILWLRSVAAKASAAAGAAIFEAAANPAGASSPVMRDVAVRIFASASHRLHRSPDSAAGASAAAPQ